MKKPPQKAERGSHPEPTRLQDPFASLKSLREGLPVGPLASEKVPDASSAKKAAKGPARAMVRYERKGRGGKEATVVDGLELPKAALEEWLHVLKVSLGCGGMLEENRLVLQGDQRPRIGALLERRGVRRVIVG